jgi:uncharacterized protein (TIGR02453 family)
MSKGGHFSPAMFEFLRALKKNNNREWFVANKTRYEEEVRDPLLRFITDLRPRLTTISRHLVADPHPTRGSMLRIYRDVRFSRDKSPYKVHAAAHFVNPSGGRDMHAPGFYLHLEPGNSFGAAGLWHPDSPSLRTVRDRIVSHPREWQAVLATKLPLGGDRLTRPPQGYDPAHRFVEDLERKDFITSIRFTDRQVCSPRFLTEYVEACRRMSPLMAFLTKAVNLAW